MSDQQTCVAGTMTCELCGDARLVCPGCTGGRIQPELRMGCGNRIRCPWCVDYEGALEDVRIFKKHYLDEEASEVEERYDDIYKSIKQRYPEFKEE